MSADTVCIETRGVKEYFDADHMFSVLLGERKVVKRARDLQADDTIMGQVESIETALERAEEYFEKSSAYMFAKKRLFERNTDGRWIPRLRRLLVERLADGESAYRASLEQKILKEGADFSADEYAYFVSRIAPHVSVKKEQVREWLKGGIVVPADWDNFSRLAAVNPECAAIAAGKGMPDGFHAAYVYYVGARSSAFWGRNGVSENGHAPRNIHPSGSAHNKHDLERQLVHEGLAKYIIRNIVPLKITSVTHVEHPKNGNIGHPASSRLSRSIVPDIDIPELGMGEVRDTAYLLDNAMIYWLHGYVNSRMESYDNLGLPLVANFIFTRMVRNAPAQKFRFEQYLEHVSRVSGKSKNKLRSQLETFYMIFNADFESGRAGEIIGVPSQELFGLVDLVNHYRTALPKAYFEKQMIEMRFDIVKEVIAKSQLKGKDLKRARHEYAFLEQKQGVYANYLSETYGLAEISKAMFLIEFYTDILSKHPELAWQQLEDTLLIKAYEAYVKKGYSFYSREEVASLFGRLGIPHAVDLYDPRNFGIALHLAKAE